MPRSRHRALTTKLKTRRGVRERPMFAQEARAEVITSWAQWQRKWEIKQNLKGGSLYKNVFKEEAVLDEIAASGAYLLSTCLRSPTRLGVTRCSLNFSSWSKQPDSHGLA